MPAPGRLGPLAMLRARAVILGAIRSFFAERDYLAVETPVRLPAPALELHIDAIPAGTSYLRTSPELHLKRLLAAGAEKVVEIGPCFRSGERGRLHLPEFTMVEWYVRGADYHAMITETEALVAAVAATLAASDTAATKRRPPPESSGGRRFVATASITTPLATERPTHPPFGFAPPWERLTVREAFQRHAGWDPVAAYDPDRFDLDLVLKVEPALPHDRPLILMDYPVEAAALARCRPDCPPVAERWELYAGGMELANAFSELTDAAEQRRRFVACAAERARLGKPVYPLDEAFLAALEQGLPPCAGVALGLDRLVMLLTGAPCIDDVRAFVPEA